VKERLLTYRQVGERLAGASRRTIRRYVDKGKLHPRAFGGLTVFLESEVDALVAAVKAAPVRGAPWRGKARRRS